MYFDTGWGDWDQNALTKNMLDGLYVRSADSISVSRAANPIMAPDSGDMFIKTLKLTPPPEKVGPPKLLSERFRIKAYGTFEFESL